MQQMAIVKVVEINRNNLEESSALVNRILLLAYESYLSFVWGVNNAHAAHNH